MDARNKDGDTPLAVAKSEGHDTMEALLRQHETPPAGARGRRRTQRTRDSARGLREAGLGLSLAPAPLPRKRLTRAHEAWDSQVNLLGSL